MKQLSHWVWASLILAVGLFLPLVAMSDLYDGVSGTIVGPNGRPVKIGKTDSQKIGFYAATPTPKPIIVGAPSAANIESALAALGLLATATPTPTPTATFTPTPTPTP